MTATLTDLLGFLGVGLVLGLYYLLQAQKLAFDDYSYLIGNITGSGLILVSLSAKFNPASFVIEIAWIAISVFGLVKRLRRDRSP